MGDARVPGRYDEPADSGGDRGSSGFRARELLLGGAPREVLEKIFTDDPLEIRARCSQHLRSEALLLSLDRLFLRAIARTAYAAMRYRGKPALDEWLEERIAISVRELIEEDREWQRANLPTVESPDEASRYLLGALGIEVSLARGAWLAFNTQPWEVRRAFHALVVERVPFKNYVAESCETPDRVRDHLRRAFQVLGLEPGFGLWDDVGGVFSDG